MRRAVDGCLPDRPELGEVVVAPIACEAMQVPRGAERAEDWWFANHWFRAVVRSPQASLSLTGTDGATLVDAATWESGDWMYEAAPLVDGGWLAIDSAEAEVGTLAVHGSVVSLPDLRVPEGAASTVQWRVEPDDPWLHLEGSNGLWLHPVPGLALHDGWLWGDFLVYGHDGVVREDLGGALRIERATALLIADPVTALATRSGSTGIQLSGTAVGAERLKLLRGGEVVGKLPVSPEGAFEAVIPADIEWVRAEAAGRADSVRLAPGPDLELQIGGTGSFQLRPAWPEGRQRQLRIDWVAFDGRSGRSYLPANGGALFLGFGAYALTITAGPAFEPVVVEVEADGNTSEIFGFAMIERFDPGDHVIAVLDAPCGLARTWPDTDVAAASLAASDGADFVVFTPEDDVAAVVDSSTSFPAIAHENGSKTTAPDGTWSIVSWPWTQIAQRPGHGAVDAGDLTPVDALAAAVGGVTRDRHTIVDLAWIEAAPAPFLVDPAPEGVRLEPPGADGPAAWAPWYRWLDAARPLSAVGPLTWVPVADPALVASEDVAQAFTAGRTIASTGPLIELEVAGGSPGDVGLPEATAVLGRIWVGGASELDHVALVGDGGEILAQWDLTAGNTWQTTAVVRPRRWVIAAGWDDLGTSFAATSPVWTDPP